MNPLNLYEFEAVPDAPMPAGSEAVEPESEAPAPAGTEAVEAPVDEEFVEEEPTPEEMWESVRELVREEMEMSGWTPPAGTQPDVYDPYGGQMPQPDYGQQPGYGGPQPTFDWTQVDPYEENFGQQLGQGLSQTVEQVVQRVMDARLGPITNTLQAAQEEAEAERSEEMIGDMLDAELSAGSDLTEASKAMLRPLADALVVGIQGDRPPNPRWAEMAIRQAADMLRQGQIEAAQGGVQQHTNQMANLNQAPATTPPAGTLAAVPTASAAPPLDAAALARKWGIKPR